MQPRRALWTMPLVHSSHSCTICRQPRSPRRAFPPWTHTPAYCCAPSGHGRRGASTARARCLSHSANTQPNPSPAAQPLASPVGGKGERTRQPQRWAGTPEPPGVGGGAQLRFNSWQGEGEAAAQEGSRGSSRLGNRERWNVSIRCEERGAHWPEGGGQDPQERGTPGANARRCRQQGRGRKERGHDA